MSWTFVRCGTVSRQQLQLKHAKQNNRTFGASPPTPKNCLVSCVCVAAVFRVAIRTGSLHSIKKWNLLMSNYARRLCLWPVHCLIRARLAFRPKESSSVPVQWTDAPLSGPAERERWRKTRNHSSGVIARRNATDLLALVMMQSQPFCHHKKSPHQQISITPCEKTFSPSFGWKENFKADMTVFERKIFFFTRSLTNIRADDSLHTGNFHCQGSWLAYPSSAARRWLPVSAICRITVDCRPHFPNDIESSRQNVLHFADFFGFFFLREFPVFSCLVRCDCAGMKIQGPTEKFLLRVFIHKFRAFRWHLLPVRPFSSLAPAQDFQHDSRLLSKALTETVHAERRAIFATHRCSVETFRSAKNSRESLLWDWEPHSIAS